MYVHKIINPTQHWRTTLKKDSIMSPRMAIKSKEYSIKSKVTYVMNTQRLS